MKAKTKVVLQPDAADEDYLRARRVNSMHQKFMREVVVPSRKETT
jgi:hypothetical protein